MKLSVVIPHYWAERNGNLRQIVEALYEGSVKPNEVIIWNNCDVPLAPIKGAAIVQSPRNYGCLARFIASYAARGEFVMFQDNDTCVTKDTIKNLLWYEQEGVPGHIVSIDGWSFTENKTYTDGVKTLRYGWDIARNGTDVTNPVSVDVTPGHIELINRGQLQRILAIFPFEDSTVMEDIWFNACAERLGIKRYVVPSVFRLLSEQGVGICQAPNFFEERDQLCQRLF